jgi:hypothetical protein
MPTVKRKWYPGASYHVTVISGLCIPLGQLLLGEK